MPEGNEAESAGSRQADREAKTGRDVFCAPRRKEAVLSGKKVVRGAGLEPACLTAKDPKSFVSANFTSRA